MLKLPQYKKKKCQEDNSSVNCGHVLGYIQRVAFPKACERPSSLRYKIPPPLTMVECYI